MAVRLDLGDCEARRDSFPVQPINTLSSAGLVVVGAAAGIAAHRDTVPNPLPHRYVEAFSATVAIAGIGSVAYHGMATRPGRYVHDLSNLGVLLFIAGSEAPRLGWARRSAWMIPAVGGVGSAVVLGARPEAINALAAAGVGSIAALRFSKRRTVSRTRVEQLRIVVVAGALVAYVNGRSSGGACQPDSRLQWHGLWHLLTAGALGLWSLDMRGGAVSPSPIASAGDQ